MNFLSIDLEMNQPTNTIIQVGIAIGNVANSTVLKEYSSYIKINETINPFITNLTKITDKDIQSGLDINTVCEEIERLYIKYKCCSQVLVWGSGDIKLIKSQSNNFIKNIKEINVKSIYATYCLANNITMKGGLVKAVEKVGLQFIGTPHNALYDAINTLHIYSKIMRLLRV